MPRLPRPLHLLGQLLRLLLLLALAAGAVAAPEPPARAVLALEDPAGASQSLETLRGRVVVLNFWATWCIPCRKEMPLLQEISQAYGSRGVAVVGASADEAGTEAKVEADAKRLGVTFPVWTGATTEDMARLGLGSELPATALVDRDGTIAARLRGVVTEQDLRKRLDWLLSDRLAPRPWTDEAPKAAPRKATASTASLVPS